MSLISLKDFDFSFPATSGGFIRVLNNISLDVYKGEVLAVLGPSGCGKSTLLRILAGLLPVDNGHLHVEPSIAESPLAISMNFQRPVLLPWLTVTQNALLPFELTASPVENAVNERLNRLLEIVGLSGFKDALPSELSGGMLMRAALVRSFVTAPQLVLMDEPFASLDEVTRNRLCVELRNLAQSEHTTIVFVTHSIQEAVFIANRVLLLSARPARVVTTVAIDLPATRTSEIRRCVEFLDHCDRLYGKIAHG